MQTSFHRQHFIFQLLPLAPSPIRRVRIDIHSTISFHLRSINSFCLGISAHMVFKCAYYGIAKRWDEEHGLTIKTLWEHRVGGFFIFCGNDFIFSSLSPSSPTNNHLRWLLREWVTFCLLFDNLDTKERDWINRTVHLQATSYKKGGWYRPQQRGGILDIGARTPWWPPPIVRWRKRRTRNGRAWEPVRLGIEVERSSEIKVQRVTL